MKFGELRQYIPCDTTIWLQATDTGECLDVNENNYIDGKYNDMEVVTFFNERYPSIGESGITVIVEKECENDGKKCSA